MNVKQLKQYLAFLQKLEPIMELTKAPLLSLDLVSLYSDNDLREIIRYLHPKEYDAKEFEKAERQKLMMAIHSNYDLLLWTIHQLEYHITRLPTYSQEEITTFFSDTNNEMHYLASKPADTWDEYDFSNYHSLMQKSGRSKRVFAIFTSDVLKEDVYAVTTKPTLYFDTKEEAELEIQQLISKGEFKKGDLTVHSLWRII